MRSILNFWPLVYCSFIVEKHKNVLLIVVDDLRPAIRALGDKNAITPNLDKLAQRSTVYTNAHAQVKFK